MVKFSYEGHSHSAALLRIRRIVIVTVDGRRYDRGLHQQESGGGGGGNCDDRRSAEEAHEQAGWRIIGDLGWLVQACAPWRSE